MQDAATIERIRAKYIALSPVMDERVRRHWAAAEAMALGWGGITIAALATGLARNTIATGVRELMQRGAQSDVGIDVRLRRPGGGRKPIAETDPLLLRALEELDNADVANSPPIDAPQRTRRFVVIAIVVSLPAVGVLQLRRGEKIN